MPALQYHFVQWHWLTETVVGLAVYPDRWLSQQLGYSLLGVFSVVLLVVRKPLPKEMPASLGFPWLPLPADFSMHVWIQSWSWSWWSRCFQESTLDSKIHHNQVVCTCWTRSVSGSHYDPSTACPCHPLILLTVCYGGTNYISGTYSNYASGIWIAVSLGVPQDFQTFNLEEWSIGEFN